MEPAQAEKFHLIDESETSAEACAQLIQVFSAHK